MARRESRQSGSGSHHSTGNEWGEDIEEHVQTPFGPVKVSIYGDRRNHPIVTFHDIGMDCEFHSSLHAHLQSGRVMSGVSAENNFQNFFQFGTIVEFGRRFCVYNINAPGQETDARALPEDFVYPNMDQLAGIVAEVQEQFKFPSFLGMGVGAGANVMLRYAVGFFIHTFQRVNNHAMSIIPAQQPGETGRADPHQRLHHPCRLDRMGLPEGEHQHPLEGSDVQLHCGLPALAPLREAPRGLQSGMFITTKLHLKPIHSNFRTSSANTATTSTTTHTRATLPTSSRPISGALMWC